MVLELPEWYLYQNIALFGLKLHLRNFLQPTDASEFNYKNLVF